MIQNMVYGSGNNSIDHILIKPYRVVLLSDQYPDVNKSTDPSVVFDSSHSSCNLTLSFDGYSCTIASSVRRYYQLLQEHQWFAVYNDGTKADLTKIVKSSSISVQSSLSESSGGTTYNWWALNEGVDYAYTSDSFMSPDSLGHSVHNASGGTSYQNGCFSYISCNSKTGADNYTVTVNINTVKIDGIQYPISIPRGYIYDSSIAHPQMLSSVSAGGTILVAGRTYYKVNDGDVITSLITIGNTTGIYNGPMNQKYPLFLSKNENAVEHYHNGNSTHLTAITSIIYNGETWYCGDVQSPQTTTTSSTYYTGGTLGNVSNGIPSHLCIGLIPVDLGNDIKINAIKKAAKKTLDWYYNG